MRSVPGAISRTSKRTFDAGATCPSTEGSGASPPARPLNRPPVAPKPRAQLALFTFTVPLTIGAVAGPCSASVGVNRRSHAFGISQDHVLPGGGHVELAQLIRGQADAAAEA